MVDKGGQDLVVLGRPGTLHRLRVQEDMANGSPIVSSHKEETGIMAREPSLSAWCDMVDIQQAIATGSPECLAFRTLGQLLPPSDGRHGFNPELAEQSVHPDRHFVWQVPAPRS